MTSLDFNSSCANIYIYIFRIKDGHYAQLHGNNMPLLPTNKMLTNYLNLVAFKYLLSKLTKHEITKTKKYIIRVRAELKNSLRKPNY